MSNNPTPPRIEREALAYAEKTWEHFRPCIERTAHIGQSLADYGRGKIEEYNRAVPVVKALYAALGILELNQIEPEMAEEFKKILQTYKSDV